MDIFSQNGRRTRLQRGFLSPLEGFFTGFRKTGVAIKRRFFAELDAVSLWVPVFMGVGIAFYFSLPVETDIGWTVIILACLSLSAFRLRHQGGWGIVAIGLFCAGLGFTSAQVRANWVAAPAISDEIAGAALNGRIINASRNRRGGTTLLVAPTQISGLEDFQLPARVRLKVGQSETILWPGDVISTRVMLWPPAEPGAPGAFDVARQSWFRQLGATGITLTAPIVHQREASMNWRVNLNSVREGITRRIITAMDNDTGPVAAAMMTGQRDAINERVEQDLRDAGLAHILAISGLHMALFAGTLFWLIRAGFSLVPRLALFLPLKKWAASAALVGALAYLLLSGMSVATQRAFIMAALMFLAILLDRPAISLRNVALAAVIILITRPESLLEPGFQMSFAAVTALIAVYQNRELQLLGFRERATGTSGIVKFAAIYVATLALTSLVAGAATAPFAAFHFNRIAVFGIVGNLLAMPLVGGVIMPAALIAYLLMPLGLEAPALWVMELGLSAVLVISADVSGWQGAVAYAPSFSVAALGTITIGGLMLTLLRTELRYSGLLLLGVGFAWSTAQLIPDILIDGEAKLVAVRQSDGTYAWSGRSPKYARETWLRRSGNAPDRDIRDSFMACDLTGCVTQSGVMVAISRSAAALSDDCQHAEILVSFLPVRGAQRRNCQASLIIDRFDIARNGAYAIYLGPEDGKEDGSVIERLETVRQWRGTRPWTER